eukprot:2902176-Rhodomonas_salina.2
MFAPLLPSPRSQPEHVRCQPRTWRSNRVAGYRTSHSTTVAPKPSLRAETRTRHVHARPNPSPVCTSPEHRRAGTRRPPAACGPPRPRRRTLLRSTAPAPPRISAVRLGAAGTNPRPSKDNSTVDSTKDVRVADTAGSVPAGPTARLARTRPRTAPRSSTPPLRLVSLPVTPLSLSPLLLSPPLSSPLPYFPPLSPLSSLLSPLASRLYFPLLSPRSSFLSLPLTSAHFKPRSKINDENPQSPPRQACERGFSHLISGRGRIDFQRGGG